MCTPHHTRCTSRACSRRARPRPAAHAAEAAATACEAEAASDLDLVRVTFTTPRGVPVRDLAKLAPCTRVGGVHARTKQPVKQTLLLHRLGLREYKDERNTLAVACLSFSSSTGQYLGEVIVRLIRD